MSAAFAGESGDALVLGVSRWKRGFVTPFVAPPHRRVVYRRPTPQALAQARRERMRLHVWASREPPWLAAAAAAAGLAVTRIEDGFLRSVGLGSNFVPALSLVLDADGIYFDPSRPSRIENLLNDPDFPAPALRAAARRLRRRLVAHGVSKYNLRGNAPAIARRGKRVILVPGQVEDDRAIVLGSPRIKRNLDLLAAVRDAAPDAVILYKPHPEIEAGNRRGAVPQLRALRYADRVLNGWDIDAALAATTEVHTMTSLAGFEALLRGLPVTVYGLPFYAGLGLTTDRVPWPRPRRAVDLDTLVAGVLLAYPRYRDPAGRDADAFEILELLERQRATAPATQTPLTRRLRWLRLTAGI